MDRKNVHVSLHKKARRRNVRSSGQEFDLTVTLFLRASLARIMHSSTFPLLLRGHARVAIRPPSEQKKKQVENSKKIQNWASYALRLSKNADAWLIEKQKQNDITEPEPSKKRHSSLVQPPWKKQPLCLRCNIHRTQRECKPECDDGCEQAKRKESVAKKNVSRGYQHQGRRGKIVCRLEAREHEERS